MNEAPHHGRIWLNGLLFLATVLSACYVGLGWGASYLAFGPGAASATNVPAEAARALADPRVFQLSGLYAAVLMTILMGHELGHYLTCRRYGVLATLPYFIPFPNLIGTMGAFIKIKSPIRFKHQLFDIGANGPLVGFALALPALVIGLAFSRVTTAFPPESGISFGEPLVFKLLSGLFFGRTPEHAVLILHPVGFAGWVGALVTSFNLMPLGQLDGGHVAYALLGRRAWGLSRAMLVVFALLGVLFWAGWFLWAGLILLIDFRSKKRFLNHPAVEDEDVRLDPRRRLLGVLVAIVFLLSFIPDPVQGFDLLSILKGLIGGAK